MNGKTQRFREVAHEMAVEGIRKRLSECGKTDEIRSVERFLRQKEMDDLRWSAGWVRRKR